MVLDERHRLVNASRYPQLQLFAGWHWGKPGLNPTLDEWMDYGVVGAGLNWLLWQGGARKLNNQVVSSLQAAQYYQLSATIKKSENAYNNAVIVYHALEQELELVKQNCKLTGLKMAGMEARLQHNDAAGSQLRDTLLELTQVETEELILCLQLAQQRTEIERLSGMPLAEWSL